MIIVIQISFGRNTDENQSNMYGFEVNYVQDE